MALFTNRDVTQRKNVAVDIYPFVTFYFGVFSEAGELLRHRLLFSPVCE